MNYPSGRETWCFKSSPITGWNSALCSVDCYKVAMCLQNGMPSCNCQSSCSKWHVPFYVSVCVVNGLLAVQARSSVESQANAFGSECLCGLRLPRSQIWVTGSVQHECDMHNRLCRRIWGVHVQWGKAICWYWLAVIWVLSILPFATWNNHHG